MKPDPIEAGPPAVSPQTVAAMAVAPPPEPAPVATPPEDEGLTLRFASDGDFLRLIARGDIRVYAYQAHDILSLDGSYRFLESNAPGQVYELLRESIPVLVLNALRDARGKIDGYRWGIALPIRISGQIERYLDQVRSGQLVIDRYGDVRHVAAS